MRCRSPCEAWHPPAFTDHERLWNYLAGFPAWQPLGARRGRRAVNVRPKRICLRSLVPPFDDASHRHDHGSTVLKRRARSLLGFLRAPLLRMAVEHPSVTASLPRTPGVRSPRRAWSIAPSFPGGEGPRLASRAGLGLHSTARPRRLTICAKTRVLSTDRPEHVRRSPPLRARSVSPSRRP